MICVIWVQWILQGRRAQQCKALHRCFLGVICSSKMPLTMLGHGAQVDFNCPEAMIVVESRASLSSNFSGSSTCCCFVFRCQVVVLHGNLTWFVLPSLLTFPEVT